MIPMVWPPDPHFKSDGEKDLFKTLRGLLDENDALLANLRFIDSQMQISRMTSYFCSKAKAAWRSKAKADLFPTMVKNGSRKALRLHSLLMA